MRRVSNATAVEARIISAQQYVSTRGANMGAALSCDGGPLANSAHDPRWGRISETYLLRIIYMRDLYVEFVCESLCIYRIYFTRSRYGEDGYHIQAIGVTAMRGLQNPHPVPGGKPVDVFFCHSAGDAPFSLPLSLLCFSLLLWLCLWLWLWLWL